MLLSEYQSIDKVLMIWYLVDDADRWDATGV